MCKNDVPPGFMGSGDEGPRELATVYVRDLRILAKIIAGAFVLADLGDREVRAGLIDLLQDKLDGLKDRWLGDTVIEEPLEVKPEQRPGGAIKQWLTRFTGRWVGFWLSLLYYGVVGGLVFVALG